MFSTASAVQFIDVVSFLFVEALDHRGLLLPVREFESMWEPYGRGAW